MAHTGTDHDRAAETYLITDAQQALDAQQRTRVRKYLTLMAFRVPALIVAGIVYSATQNGLLALAIVALSIPLPWVAVLIANDRPARKRGEEPRYRYGATTTPAPGSALPRGLSTYEDPDRTDPARDAEHPVIDGDGDAPPRSS